MPGGLNVPRTLAVDFQGPVVGDDLPLLSPAPPPHATLGSDDRLEPSTCAVLAPICEPQRRAAVALHVVSAWLGHSSVAQTNTYLSINLPQLHDATSKLEAAQRAGQETARQAAERRSQDGGACRNPAIRTDSDTALETPSPASPTIQ
jgi:hypothetical protein